MAGDEPGGGSTTGPRIDGPRTSVDQDDIVDFDGFSTSFYRTLYTPLRAYFSPKYYGLDHVSADRPTLFVANHTIYGLIDTALLAAELVLNKGIRFRGLADTLHFTVPGWSDFLRRGGAVIGTRENCDRLMEAGQHVLVFPGGGREVTRRRGEAYKLIWKNRTGFIRLALKHGYTITPVAQVGVEDAYDVIIDADDIMASPLGTLLKRTGIAKKYMRNGDMIFPLARGLGLTMLPRPERLYFSFGRPIDTSPYAHSEDSEALRLELRAKVARAVNDEIRKLLHIREQDTDKGLLRRILTKYG